MSAVVSSSSASGAIPKVMRALVMRRLFTPFDQCISLENDVRVPQPKNGQVLIKVSHSALNPADVKILPLGWPMWALLNKLEGGVYVPGKDVAGQVVRAEGTRRIHEGDRVVAFVALPHVGGMAEYMVLPEDLVVLAPRSLSAAEACSFPLASLTSRTALDALALPKKAKLLVLAGGSATGCYGIQLAKHVDGVEHVATTCGTASVSTCRQFGADLVIDYKTHNWWEQLKGEQYDAILDCAGGQFEHAHEVLKPGGQYASIAGDSPHEQPSLWMIGRFFFNSFHRSVARLFSSTAPQYKLINLHYSLDKFQTIASHFDPAPSDNNGGTAARPPLLRPYIDRVLPLAQWKDVFALQLSEHAHGKIVLEI